MKKIFLIIVSVLLSSGLSYAQEDSVVSSAKSQLTEFIPDTGEHAFYVGLGGSYIGLYNDITLEDFTATSKTIQLGYQYGDYIALEGRYSSNFGDVAYNGGSVGTDTDNYGTDVSNMALYLKPSFPLGNVMLYGLVGYGSVEFSDILGGARVESGFQWGLGVGYIIGDTYTIFVDYSSLYSGTGFNGLAVGSDQSVSLYTVGISYRF